MTLFDTSDVRELSLVRLSSEVARAMAGIGRVAVAGEVVRPREVRGGRRYFILRDRAAQMSILCPATRRARCRVVEGERVRVTGSLSWSSDRAQVHLVAEEVVPLGEGAIAAALAEVRERLRADGLLDRPRRPLPVLPSLIGVVCGTDAAVRADIEAVVEARFPGYPILFSETTVSGPGAAASIQEALLRLDANEAVDVVVLARGGGDATALLPFSDEELCRSICTTRCVVVSAIGHQGDHPVCDDVADARFGTPSLAAAAVVPLRSSLEADLDRAITAVSDLLRARLDRCSGALERIDPYAALSSGLLGARDRLERVEARLEFSKPDQRLVHEKARLAGLPWSEALHRRVSAAASSLQGALRTLEAHDPQAVLRRGYAVVRRLSDGSVVRDPDVVVDGELLGLHLAEGTLMARAEKGAAEKQGDGR